jgi:hypothetical protein
MNANVSSSSASLLIIIRFQFLENGLFETANKNQKLSCLAHSKTSSSADYFHSNVSHLNQLQREHAETISDTRFIYLQSSNQLVKNINLQLKLIKIKTFLSQTL